MNLAIEAEIELINDIITSAICADTENMAANETMTVALKRIATAWKSPRRGFVS